MATIEELTALTKDELIARLPEEIGSVAARASKEDVAKAILYLEGVPPLENAGVRKVIIIDPVQQRTTLDLATGHFDCPAMGRQIEEGVIVEGTGDVLTLDLSSMFQWKEATFEFDPPPDVRPVVVTLSTEE